MTARGIKVSQDGQTRKYAAYASVGFHDANAQDFAICGWMRIKGASPGSQGEGHYLFYLPNTHNSDNGGVGILASDANSASPWSIFGRLYNSSSVQDTSMTASPATDQDWFFGLYWNHTTGTATWFYALDEAGSVSTATGTPGYTYGGGREWDGIYIGDPDYAASDKGSNIEVTNLKVWAGSGGSYSGPTSAANMLAEMTSEAVVNSNSLFDHWTLNSSSDLTGANGHAFVLTGAVTSGTMDPVDIQTAGATRKVLVIS